MAEGYFGVLNYLRISSSQTSLRDVKKKKKKKAADLIFLSSFQGELSFPSKTNAHPEIYRFIWLLCFALLVNKLLEAGTGYLIEPSC